MHAAYMCIYMCIYMCTGPASYAPMHAASLAQPCLLTYLPTYPLTHLPTYPLTHLPTYPLTHLPTYLLTYLLRPSQLCGHARGVARLVRRRANAERDESRSGQLLTYLLTYLRTYLLRYDAEPMLNGTRAALDSFFAPHSRRLARLLGWAEVSK